MQGHWYHKKVYTEIKHAEEGCTDIGISIFFLYKSFTYKYFRAEYSPNSEHTVVTGCYKTSIFGKYVCTWFSYILQSQFTTADYHKLASVSEVALKTMGK